MKKNLLVVLLALCLCLSMVFVSCKKDPDPSGETPDNEQTELGEKKGEVYYTADPGGDVEAPEPNEPVPGDTLLYETD